MSPGPRAAAAGVALALLALATFGSAVRSDFVGFDDRLYVTQNPQVRSGIDAASVAWAFRTFHTGNYHPLTWLSHMVDAELFGVSPAGHHATSVLLHAANALLLLLALRRLTGSPWRSAFAAALFALHPLRVESVAWVAERKDLLCGLFWMLGLLAYASYAARPRVRSYLLVAACLVLALLSKPMAVTFPAVLLLLDFWPLRRFASVSARRLIAEKAPLLALAAASSAVTFLAQRAGGNVTALDALPLAGRLANAVVSYVRYLGLAAWPDQLSFFYPYPREVTAWAVAGSAVLLVAVTAGVLGAARRAPYLATGWGWYLGTLLPVAGIVQVGAQAMADRYTYLPLVGAGIAVAWGASDLAARFRVPRPVLATAAALVLAALAARTVAQVGVWRDSVTLYGQALANTRDNYVVEDLLGSVLAREGRIDEAVAHHEAALRIEPRFATAHANLANALFLRGDATGAISHYREAIRLKPARVEPRANLALALMRAGRPAEAAAELREALRLRPDDESLRRRLDEALAASR